MTRKINSIPPKRLAETITAAATSFKLNNILGFDDIALTESIIGDTVYCSFQDTTGKYLEFMKIDPSTIASASITILKRGLSFNEDGTETEVPANKRQWIKNQTIVNLGTDNPMMFNLYVKTADDQTVAGVKTFSSSPIVPTPTTNMQASTKKYVDDNLALKLDDSQIDTDATLAADSDSKIPSQKAVKTFVQNTSYAGTVNASETTKGIVEIATQAEVDAGTDTGGTGAKLTAVPSTLISLKPIIETTTSATYSLTTVANQVVTVFAEATYDCGVSITAFSVDLKYNGVTKDTYSGSTVNTARVSRINLMYTETPGAGTQNITLTSSVGTLSQIKIIVIKTKA